MGFALLPLAAIIFFVGIIAIEQTNNSHIAPSRNVVKGRWEAQSFVAYRDAIHAYLESNPDFLGVVPVNLLSTNFPVEFLSISGNTVSATPSRAGRIITSYAALQPDAIRSVRILTHNDSSIYVDTNGNVVSVIQVGV